MMTLPDKTFEFRFSGVHTRQGAILETIPEIEGWQPVAGWSQPFGASFIYQRIEKEEPMKINCYDHGIRVEEYRPWLLDQAPGWLLWIVRRLRRLQVKSSAQTRNAPTRK